MPSYILRDIDPREWKRMKERAQREGHPLRFLFLKFVRAYANGALVLSLPMQEPEENQR